MKNMLILSCLVILSCQENQKINDMLVKEITDIAVPECPLECPQQVVDQYLCPVCPEIQTDMNIQRQTLNLREDEDNLTAWLKTRGSINLGEETVFYWSGYIYEIEEKNPDDYRQIGVPTFESPILKFEGFNVARFLKDQAGNHIMLSREASFYINPDTNKIIDCWLNTMLDTPKEVPVLHVWNDPVNFGTGYVDFLELDKDKLSFYTDILVSYRSPLAANENYLPYSASDVYQSSELFNFYVKRSDLENPMIASAPVEISWTRIGQYLPWMQMGQKNGKLLYAVRGYKLPNGWQDLPQKIKDRVTQENKLEFMNAPSEIPDGFVPNMTSWRYFKQQFDSGNYQITCQ